MAAAQAIQAIPMMAATEAHKPAEESAPVASIDFSKYSQKIVSFLARNFYTMKYIALVMAFCMNFILLFYKVKVNSSS